MIESMKGWPVARIETEKRRAAVLKHLDDTPGYKLNAELLTLGAEAQGIPTTSDQMLDALHWLADLEMVQVHEPAGTQLVIAELTRAGRDVARGKRVVRGVARPGPEL